MFENMTRFEPRNPKYREYMEGKVSRNKFMKYLGLEIKSIEPGYLQAELEFKEFHQQQNGWLHGGVTASILDIIQGFATYSLVEEGQQVFTVEAKVSYYNPGTAAKFYVRGGVVKPGKRFHFCEAEVYYLKEDGGEVIVAKGSATMAVVEGAK